MLGAAHKPGAIPLRPLGLSDVFDAAFKIIRFNPRATVGSAVLVAAVAMGLPVLVTAALTFTLGFTPDSGVGNSDLIAAAGSIGSLLLGSILRWLGTIVVTGMVVHVCAAAAIGRRLSLGEAWAATRGKRLRLVGLSLLVALILLLMLLALVGLVVVAVLLGGRGAGGALLGVLVGLLGLPFFVWVYIRLLYLPVPALMLEDVGVLDALRRGFALSRRQFWRIFGIAALSSIVAAVAGYVLALPVSLVSRLAFAALSPEYALLGLVVAQALAAVVSAAFVSPFNASVTSLLYLDQRIRKEAYDVELMARAGILT